LELFDGYPRRSGSSATGRKDFEAGFYPWHRSEAERPQTATCQVGRSKSCLLIGKVFVDAFRPCADLGFTRRPDTPELLGLRNGFSVDAGVKILKKTVSRNGVSQPIGLFPKVNSFGIWIWGGKLRHELEFLSRVEKGVSKANFSTIGIHPAANWHIFVNC
jgi:hypothetical protein